MYFHCSRQTARAANKSAHRAHEECGNLMKVLCLDSSRGLVVPRYNALRKVRLHVPSLNCGKSGGYRVIYSVSTKEGETYIVFLACYWKGDKEDLSGDEYSQLVARASELFDDDSIEWQSVGA